MTLPSYDFCEAKIRAGTDTSLHRFIVDNEPGGECHNFRNGLADLLDEMIREAEKEISAMQETIDNLNLKINNEN